MDEALEFEIRDDGRGFDAGHVSPDAGLRYAAGSLPLAGHTPGVGQCSLPVWSSAAKGLMRPWATFNHHAARSISPSFL